MRKFIRNSLTSIILLITLVYGVGDYFKWWDNVRGRTLAIEGWKILANNSVSIKDVFINAHEQEFQQLEKIILANTKNGKIIEKHRSGINPFSITRIGSPLKPSYGDELPKGFPNPRYVPESLPVIYVYFDPKIKIFPEVLQEKNNAGKKVMSVPVNSTEPVGTLGDIRRWIEDSRNQERFYVTIILISFLSLLLFVTDVTDSKT